MGRRNKKLENKIDKLMNSLSYGYSVTVDIGTAEILHSESIKRYGRNVKFEVKPAGISYGVIKGEIKMLVG